MITRMPAPPLPYDATPEQVLAHYAELARQDAEDLRFFCCLMAASFIVLSVMGYVVVSALS